MEWTMIGVAWLGGLTGTVGIVAAWVRRVEREREGLERGLATVRREVTAARADLREVARARQFDELRRALLADLRPLVADAVDRQLTAHSPRPTVVDFGGATVAGNVRLGDVAGRDQS